MRESFPLVELKRAVQDAPTLQGTMSIVPLVVGGNHLDLERQVCFAEGQSLAQAWDEPFLETSHVTSQGAAEFFGLLARAAINHRGSLTSNEKASQVKEAERLQCL